MPKLPLHKTENIYLENDTPILFNKKSSKITPKPLTIIKSDTGKMRHFTPAAQEWFNSIYAYNLNYIKSLPSADKNLMSLLKSYFNFQPIPKMMRPLHLSKKELKRFNKINRISKANKKRSSTKKVFVGKGDLKHTSNKVIITFYIYNLEGMFLHNGFFALSRGLFYPAKRLEKTIVIDHRGKEIITYNRLFNLKEFLLLPYQSLGYLSYTTYIVDKYNTWLIYSNRYYEYLINLVETKVLSEHNKNTLFCEHSETFKVFKPGRSRVFYYKKLSSYYKKEWFKFFYLLKLNKLKSKEVFIHKLNELVNNVYNKKVVFNIVNLKKMHLSSDIYTQLVSLKLRNKNNKLYRVLKSSLRKVKVRQISKIAEKLGRPNMDEFFVNRIRNNTIDSMLNTSASQKDDLSSLLFDFYPRVKTFTKRISRFLTGPTSSLKGYNLKGYVIRRLKHLKIRGIRVEAKGRLTRRARASRSVFKMKWKGGLKNVDSSFRGLSTVMLRGHVKSNLQYSVINSKNRRGAFGVKGWVSSK